MNKKIWYYDEENASMSNTPAIIALTELHQAVLFEKIWKLQTHNKAERALPTFCKSFSCCSRLITTWHANIVKHNEERKFTHYVYSVFEDDIKLILDTISNYAWKKTDVFKWDNTRKIVYNTIDNQHYSLQGLLDIVVTEYVKSYGDPRPELNKAIEDDHNESEGETC